MTNSSATQKQNGYGFALVSLTSLFFMWGLITSLNDVLIPRLKAVFELSYTEAMMVQFCFFFAYFVVSLPAGNLVKRIGYKSGIIYRFNYCRYRLRMLLSRGRFSVI